MKTIKLIIRLIITAILILPSLLILYPSFTFFGLFFIIPIIGIIGIPFNLLIGNKEGLEESKEMAFAGFILIGLPFYFWYLFISGKNPFIEDPFCNM